MKNSSLSPSDLMDTIGQLAEILEERSMSAARGIRDTESQWGQLGRMSAQRDDHAENLLKQVKANLSRIGRFCEACCERIEGSMEEQ